MKKLSIYLLGLLLFIACTPDEFVALEEPFTTQRMEGMVGTWTVEAVTMTDLGIKDINDPEREQDLTSLLSTDKLVFVFNSDGTFEIKSAEGAEAPNFIGLTGGEWSFNEEEGDYPTMVILTQDGNQTLKLASMPRPGHDLAVAYDRVVGGTPILTYTYELTRN
ncbi:DUF5004 domain-containing protein [Limibacter armeniacum]|uniref:DUF5004 domain-containing protein n=1 Tax=Limibacter armeniacum TaxID=466084 RepID=UPI002FE61C34